MTGINCSLRKSRDGWSGCGKGARRRDRCIECKDDGHELIKWIAPVRERRVNYEQNPKRVLEILDEGSKNARSSAGTMERVREAVFGWVKKRKEWIGSWSIEIKDKN